MKFASVVVVEVMVRLGLMSVPQLKMRLGRGVGVTCGLVGGFLHHRRANTMLAIISTTPVEGSISRPCIAYSHMYL